MGKPEQGLYETLDWIRVVGPASKLERVERWMRNNFPGVVTPIAGRHFFEAGLKFTGGATLQWGHASEIIMVEFNGSTLSGFDEQDRWELLRALVLDEETETSWGWGLGLRATRLDIAMDFVDQGLSLYDHALASCGSHELCGARTFTSVDDRSLYGRRGATLYLGQRGDNGSGKLARIYDKGLETRQADEGEWERFEIECTKGVAEKVAITLAHAEPLRDCERTGRRCWKTILRAYLAGTFDFRRVSASSRREKKFRPRADWWVRVLLLIAKLERREKIDRTPTTVTRYTKWISRCVAPAFERLNRDTGIPIADLVKRMVGDVLPAKKEAGSVLEQITHAILTGECAWLNDDPPPTTE